MSFRELIDAVYDYSRVRQDTGDLSDVKEEDCYAPGRFQYSYNMPRCTLEKKQAFDKAEQRLVAALNTYIERRVKEVLEARDQPSNKNITP